jgi:Transposase DDE domain
MRFPQPHDRDGRQVHLLTRTCWSPSSTRMTGFTVKANRSALLERCQWLAWHKVPVLDRTRDRSHGQLEIRTLKAVRVRGFGFLHAAQALQVARKVRGLRGRRWPTTIVYAVTSLTHQAASPARLADLRRGHWSIENGLHWVRDVTMGEDACKVPPGPARRSWRACATSPSGSCACAATATSLPPYATTPAMPPAPGPARPRKPVNQPHPALAGASDGPLRGRSPRPPRPRRTGRTTVTPGRCQRLAGPAGRRCGRCCRRGRQTMPTVRPESR